MSNEVSVDPKVAYFPPPHHNRAIRNLIQLSNSGNRLVVFKVRSSNPERFVVKPTTGFISPASATRLTITLKRTDDNLAASTKKDRFRIALKAAPPEMVVNPLKDEAKRVWESLDSAPSLMETDLWCSYSSDVPPFAQVTFQSEDVSQSEIGAATPSAFAPRTTSLSLAQSEMDHGTASPQADPRGPSASGVGKVTFGDGGDRRNASQSRPSPAAAATATASSGSPSGVLPVPSTDVKSVREALLSAQRLKDSIQADITSLRAQEAALKQNIAAGNTRSDALARDAQALEELREKVKQARGTLEQTQQAQLDAARAAELEASSRSKASAASLNASDAATDSRLAGLGAAARTAQAAQTVISAAAATGAAEGSSTTLTAPDSIRSGESLLLAAEPTTTVRKGTMYLSTVLLLMVLAYLAGAAYRIHVHQGSPQTARILSLLPPEAREAILSAASFWSTVLF